MKTTNPTVPRIAEGDVSEANRIHFAVLAIESAARKMGIPPAEMRSRLKQQQLIDRLLLGCYNVFHTMSLEHVAEDVIEALHNWEAPSGTADNAGTKQEGGSV